MGRMQASFQPHSSRHDFVNLSAYPSLPQANLAKLIAKAIYFLTQRTQYNNKSADRHTAVQYHRKNICAQSVREGCRHPPV